MINIIDPRTIPQSMEPTIWFCNENNFIAEAIDWRTDIKGLHPWNHAMLSINQGQFVWESMSLWNAYREGSMSTYMNLGSQLGCVTLVNNSPAFANAFAKSVQQRLSRPGIENSYDFLGVFGQLVGLPELIHTPGLEYCSVDVIRHLVNACPYLPKADQLVINNIPSETNPEQLWQIILNNPQTFSVYGIYQYGVTLP
jgi:hypothetical protein